MRIEGEPMRTPQPGLLTTLRGAAVAAAVIAASVTGVADAASASAVQSGRSPMRIEDADAGCPGVEAAYVALLEPTRGILLLSAASFPGGDPVGTADGRPITVHLPRTGPWQVARAGSTDSPVRIWAARYAFRGAPVRGCVGFDKDRFSAAGDLASYVHWLVDGVYARLPAAERERRPAFRLSDRRVRLRVTRPGAGTVELSGKEGGTLACRFPDGERIYLLIPFVLDQSLERVAVDVGYTDRPYWEAAEKTMTGFAVAEPGSPAQVADPGLEVALLDVAPSIGER